jgi:hypothetical protein
MAASQPALFAAVDGEIEGEDALGVLRPLEDLRLAERADGVVIARAPVFFHALPGELVVLRATFVALRPVYEMNQVVDFAIRFRMKNPVFRCIF